jgi:hypothetical protein
MAPSCASCAWTNDAIADGEVVWSGRPDAGVKLAMMSGVFLGIAPATVTTKARSPRRARRKPLKPLRRECRLFFGGPVVTNARAFYTTRAAAGALSARHFLRPPCFWANELCKTRTNAVASTRSCVLSYPTLEGEGRLRSRWGGVTLHNEAIVIRKTSPPHPVSHFAALHVSRPSPSRDG